MKKLLLIVLSVAIGLFVFAACDLNSDPRNNEPKKLSTPVNLRVDGMILKWNAVENSEGYSVDIDGTVYSAASNSYSLSGFTDNGTYFLKVKAIGKEGYLNSDWSQVKQHTVENNIIIIDKPYEIKVIGDDPVKVLLPGFDKDFGFPDYPDKDLSLVTFDFNCIIETAKTYDLIIKDIDFAFANYQFSFNGGDYIDFTDGAILATGLSKADEGMLTISVLTKDGTPFEGLQFILELVESVH